MDGKLDKTSSDTLNIQGDLRLTDINLPKLSKNLIVPEEVNSYLRDQLNQVSTENKALKNEIQEQAHHLKSNQKKVEQLTTKIKEYEGLGANSEYVTASQLANGKIVELSRKLREKSSEIEVYKTKCAKLENNLADVKEKYESKPIIETEEKCTKVSELDQLKRLQDKLNYTTNKWIEEKNISLKLKNDLKVANKWLQQEIGDSFDTLLTLNSSNSNWRGRAQIIRDLQQKNSELREKLRTYQDKSPTPISSTESLQSMKKIENLTRENLEIKSNFEELKRKFDAAKARVRVLESECGILKTKLLQSNENSERDQNLITSLQAQLCCKNERKSDELKLKEQTIKKLHDENELLRIELEKEKCVSEKKSQELVEKSDDITILNKRIRSARPKSSYMHRHDPEGAKNAARLEVERLRLLELTEVQNKRLEEERNAHLKTHCLLRNEKQKCAKLEANLARLQLEQNSARSGYSCKSQMMRQNEADVLKDQLELAEERIKALNTRLEIEIFERKSDLQEFSKILKNQ